MHQSDHEAYATRRASDCRSRGGASARALRRALPSVIAALWLSTSACTGSLGGGDDSPGATVDRAPGTIEPGTGPASDPNCERLHPGPSPLRRLTRDEYDNTVRDLLGDDSRRGQSFPPDGEAYGFTNNAKLSAASLILVEGYAAAAKAAAERAMENAATLVDCELEGTPAESCAHDFLGDFVKRAYRRPPTDAEMTRVLDVYAAGAQRVDAQHGVKLAIEVVLQSAPFLYRVEDANVSAASTGVVPLSQYEIASRLSYLLWGSMPDDALFAAAEAGELGTADAVAEQARRMLNDEKAEAVVSKFHEEWLNADALVNAEKSPEKFPEFTDEVKLAMLEETRQFTANVVLSGDGALSTLLSAPFTYANEELAAVYDASVSGSAFAKTELDPTQRAGLLTQGAFLVTHSDYLRTSPVQRGRFVRERLLCQQVPQPPDDVSTDLPKLSPDATARELFAAHTADPSCATCHELMDPIGYGFEHYDAMGAWRTSEEGRPVDANGELVATAEDDGTFVGAVDLAQRLSTSDEVRHCYATQWFRFASGREETEEDACNLSLLRGGITHSRGDVRELLVQLTQTDGFLNREMER